MGKKKVVVSTAAAAIVGIAIAGWLWYQQENGVEEVSTSPKPRVENAATQPGGLLEQTSSSASRTESQNEIQHDKVESAPPALASPNQDLAPVEEAMIAANRGRLLVAAGELTTRVAELKVDEAAVPVSHKELARWAEVLYQDALLAQLAHGELKVSLSTDLRRELASAQIMVNPQRIPEPLPSAEDGYGQYLRELLETIGNNQSTLTDAQALSLALKIQGLLERRKRHSDNLYLSDVRAFILDSCQDP